MFQEALDKLAEFRRDKKTDNFSQYMEMLKAIATNEKKQPTTEEIDQIMSDAGKKVSDLERDLNRYAERMQARKTIAEADAAEKEKPAIVKKLDKLIDEFEAVEKKHEESLWPLRDQLTRIANLVSKKDMAERRLDELRWPEFDGERKELAEELRQAGNEANEARKHLTAMKARLESESVELVQKAQQNGLTPDLKERQEELKQYVKNAEKSADLASERVDAAVKAQEDFIKRSREF